MNVRSYFRNILLAILWGSLMALYVVLGAVRPDFNLPTMDIPLLLVLSVLPLLAEHYLGRSTPCAPIVSAALAALTFGLMPLCAGLVTAMTAVKLALAGGVTFAVCSLLFDSAVQRLASGPRAKAAPLLTAFCLYLASQCFTNIIF